MASYKKGSRFYNGTIIQKPDGKFIIFPKYIDYSTLEPVSTYTIPAGKEHRPDLISQDIYGRPDLGWHIMSFNKISHPKDLKTNVRLSVPPVKGVIF